MDYEVIKFENDNVELEVNVSPEEETVWLTKDQMATLFDRDRTVISRHINNIYKEGELDKKTSVHFLHISPNTINPKYRPPEYYNLDVVISVGHRVKSNKGILLKRFMDEYLAKNTDLSSNIIIYNNGNVNLAVNVAPEEETVWLNQSQMADLYETTRSNITIHIKNILNDGELGDSVCKDFLHTASDGKAYHTTFYNLDVILSVGFRVKSPRAVEFRKWAFTTLKKFLLKGYVVNEERTLVTQENYINLVNRIDSMEVRQDKRMDSFDSRLSNVEENQKYLLIEEKIFFENQMLDAVVFMNQLVETAKESIFLIDPYVDVRTLNAFKNKNKETSLIIVTSSKSKLNKTDIKTFSVEYFEPIIKYDNSYHDRYLILDNHLFYHFGSSINYLGKRFTQITLIKEKDIIEVLRNRLNR